MVASSAFLICSMARAAASKSGLVEATQAPVSMSISDTFTEEEPMSMPKLFMNAKIGVAGSSNFGK